MLIGFVGSPRSGKTTLSFELAAFLKNNGYAVEFIPELARDFIRANKTINKGLEEADQKAILEAQEEKEEFHRKWNSKDCITITDGSTVNSLFYLNIHDEWLLEKQILRYDLLILCDLIHNEVVDSNRIHDYEFSKGMNNYLQLNARRFSNVVYVTGFNTQRLIKVVDAVDKVLKCK